ncbi:hypothetical protein GQ44DRAFT_773545 [Phaeosphaeriaceae sp. PMI808]|nr:hypothetical protein GQ44DRAFT_773545 [Phaeosphaeriaceae sp. PMI808]
MSTRASEIAVWIDSVSVSQIVYEPHLLNTLSDKENPRPVKKRRILQDSDQTPRPLKPLRDLDSEPQFPLPPTASASSAAASEASGVEFESHQSGRLSPVKQLQILEDFEEQPIVFCNFDDNEKGEEAEDVTAMRRVTQQFADGIGILGYDDIDTRCALGSMPQIAQIWDIVETARKHDRGSGVSEDEWNSEVQHPLLKLARNTSKHRQTLDIHNVKLARIEPASLARSTLPGRVVDYVVALNPDPATKQACRCLHLLLGAPIKSWNHTTQARHNPIAINIETKGPMKSWIDGKPQIVIWTDAWLKRLALIRSNDSAQWPALPLLNAQGHDWHSLIVSKDDQKMTIWGRVDVRSTRSCLMR